ncbi:hypothetical protein SAY87_009068 [Trapa incisa]|uniref:Uncharacterized protein n=1 Tax=Trapa incisa TaxID=236973 RepID=A0AAN7PWY0_9MYRT|nr:hypothetical protein SAY87_009068 [Trapa incisa]
MKASSEKDGESRRKLRVTWAPDVYDPPPIKSELILSRDSMQQKAPKKEKRSGKKGQKGKEFSRASKESSRASGKDKKKKKQHCRAAASSKHYDIFGDGDNDDMRSFSSGVLDSTSECSSKASSQWSSSSDKKKRNGGTGVNFRRYDLPPSDSDEDDEEAEDVEACSPDPHRSSN